MIIGIEAERANLPQKTGVEVYAAELIRHLAKIDQTNQYVLYFRTKPQAWFYQLPKNFRIKVMPFPKFWTQIRLSWEMLMHPVDVLLILASVLPFIHPKKSIFTAHDIAWRFFPEAFTPFMRNYLEFSIKSAARSAAQIIAVSSSTKNDLVKHYRLPESKVTVIPLAGGEQFRPQAYEQAQIVLDKYNLTYQKYLLFVGTLQPRKNLLKLLEAYQILTSRYRLEEKLVIVGKRGWLWKPILAKIQSTPGVAYLDQVTDEDLPSIIAGASVLTLPALYEGFGLPPLEAMASGVPVVVSNVSSLPEVVGAAGVLVDPNSADSIAEGLLQVLTDKNLRAQMIERGLRQAAKFSWERTASETKALLETVGSA